MGNSSGFYIRTRRAVAALEDSPTSEPSSPYLLEGAGDVVSRL